MDDNQYRILELITRHLTGESSSAEDTELDAWLRSKPGHRAFFDSACAGGENEKRREVFARINEEEALKQFDRKINYRQIHPVRRWGMYAAAIVIPVVLAILFLWQGEPKQQIPEQIALVPGKKQATLVLSTGEKVLLQVQDSLREIVYSDGMKITNKEGNLVYQDTIREGFVQQFNELMTPRGGEYQVTLADGTMVWLNADTRLKYPMTFDADKREVYLSGEAYFEVTKDTDRPFYVVTDKLRVKVYGTQFNVNTQQQGIIRTTLVNGKVGVTVKATGNETMLSPNQMMEYNPVTGAVQVKDVDVYTYIAWKSGEFVFEDERLEDIMEQLRLWYDVEVFYTNENVKNIKFTGDATRFSDITDVLRILERTGSVEFSVSGRTVTVCGRAE